LLYFIPKIVARLEEAEAPCFMKNASAASSSKSQMLLSSLPASFLKCFRFHKSLAASAFLQAIIGKDLSFGPILGILPVD